MKRREIKVGDKFGHWTVIKPKISVANNGGYQNLCRCVCGEERIISRSTLLDGRCKSCGCVGQRDRQLKMKKGERHNNLVFIKYDGKKNNDTAGIFWCDCGGKIRAKLTTVKSGVTKSCGCIKRELISKANRKRPNGISSYEYKRNNKVEKQKNDRENLKDAYIRQYLADGCIGIKGSDIPQWMVGAKRLQLSNFRKLKGIKNENQRTG